MAAIVIGFGVALAAAGGWAAWRRREGRNGIEAHRDRHGAYRPSDEGRNPQAWLDIGF